MAKTPIKADSAAETTSEVTVTISEPKAEVAAPMSKQTLEEMEAGKKALAKYAAAK